MAKKEGIYRHLSINVGGLSTEEVAGNKTMDLCHLIQDCEADSTSISEHGLNPRNLPKHEQWAERMLGKLENQRSKISWNQNEETGMKQMWGGTGTIIQD